MHIKHNIWLKICHNYAVILLGCPHEIPASLSPGGSSHAFLIVEFGMKPEPLTKEVFEKMQHSVCCGIHKRSATSFQGLPLVDLVTVTDPE